MIGVDVDMGRTDDGVAVVMLELIEVSRAVAAVIEINRDRAPKGTFFLFPIGPGYAVANQPAQGFRPAR